MRKCDLKIVTIVLLKQMICIQRSIQWPAAVGVDVGNRLLRLFQFVHPDIPEREQWTRSHFHSIHSFWNRYGFNTLRSTENPAQNARKFVNKYIIKDILQ